MALNDTPANLWGGLSAKIARLELAVGALSLTVLLLGGSLVWSRYQGLPVYFLPPGGPGVARPGVIPDTLATAYASHWLERRYTFTPATVKAAHADVHVVLHPSLGVAFQAQAEREQALVKEHQLASQLTVDTATVQGREGTSVVVTLAASRAVYIGGRQVRDEPVQATLTVAPWHGGGRPIGLVVSQIRITPTLTVAGL
jgi:hypothetical protein